MLWAVPLLSTGWPQHIKPLWGTGLYKIVLHAYFLITVIPCLCISMHNGLATVQMLSQSHGIIEWVGLVNNLKQVWSIQTPSKRSTLLRMYAFLSYCYDLRETCPVQWRRVLPNFILIFFMIGLYSLLPFMASFLLHSEQVWDLKGESWKGAV